MLFFTDLDRTLIYSKRFVMPEDDAVLVERDGDKEIAFMTARGLALLTALSQKLPIIPVTTRNYAECMRIDLLQTLPLRHLILNNGAEILMDGKRDADYCGMIKEELLSLGLSYDEALRIFFELFGSGRVKLHRISDDFLWLVVLYSEDYDHALLDAISERLSPGGWTVAATGRKIYLIPNPISKARAVRYLKEKLGGGFTICAGDSTMDKEMVESVDLSLVPNGSELAALLPTAEKTATAGVRAGEEILEAVRRCYESGKG